MGFQFHDIAGYSSKNVKVYVYQPHEVGATPGTETEDEKALLRGAQSFDPTEEVEEERVEELGVAVKKAIYGAAEFAGSVTMLQRDLLQVARLAGNASEDYNKLVVYQFTPVNIVVKYIDPNTEAVNYSNYIGGFKARTASKPTATGGNAEITVEGSADLSVTFDGDGDVVQHEGDGSTVEYSYPATKSVVFVESPSGLIVDSDDYTDDEAGTITFNEAPEDGATIRIVYKT